MRVEAAARLLLADREKKACLAGCATWGLRGNGGAACKSRVVDRLAGAGIHCDLCEKCV